MRELFSDVGLGTTCRGHGYRYSPITGSGSPPCTACPDGGLFMLFLCYLLSRPPMHHYHEYELLKPCLSVLCFSK